MITVVRMALGEVSEIPVVPVIGSITSANVANGVVVGVVAVAPVVVVVCAPTLGLKPSSVAMHAKLVTTPSCVVRLVRVRARVATTSELGGEVVTSDTTGHLYTNTLGKTVTSILPISDRCDRYQR